jgi:hypothetical protein
MCVLGTLGMLRLWVFAIAMVLEGVESGIQGCHNKQVNEIKWHEQNKVLIH